MPPSAIAFSSLARYNDLIKAKERMMYMLCKNCGTQLPDDAHSCPECGVAIAEPVQDVEIHESVAAPVATAECPPKKSKKGLIIGIAIALVVVLAAVGIWLIPTLFPEDDDPADVLGSQSSSASSSVPSSSAGTSTPEKDKVELILNSAKLTYEMTDADVDRFYELLEQCKEAALSGKDGDTVMEISDALDEQYNYMDTQHSIANVLYYCDLNDEDASQLYLDCTDQVTQANNDYLEMAKELYDADFPAKERFFEEWTDLDLALLKNYTSEVMELRQRNSEITVAYQDLQDDAELYSKMVPLYIELVQNNNRMAQIFGYDNYYDYAYDLVYTRDYGSEEIETMRDLAAEYLPETIENAMNSFNSSLAALNNSQQMKLSAFMYNAFTDTHIDELEGYFSTLPEQMREDMLDMFNGNIVMMKSVPSAMEGAFTTAITDDRQICFFGPGYMSPLTAIHEVGHYYGGKHTYLNDLPLDLAETQSQSNEWLFLSYLDEEMNNKLHDTAVDYKLYSDLVTIILCVIIDDFEEQVYTHPNVAKLTSFDLDQIMVQVCEKYGGIAFIENYATDIQNYWRMVVVEQPVYYISYGVSAIAAIDVFTIAEEDYEQAVEIYRTLIEEVDLEEGFLGNIQNAELDGPFDEEVYIKLLELCQ